MSENVAIELVGASTYNTLSEAFKEGLVYAVTLEVWSRLKDVKHPVTGEVMFGLQSQRKAAPPSPVLLAEEDSAAALPPVDDSVPDGADLSDLEADDAAMAAPEPVPAAPATPAEPLRRKFGGGRKSDGAVQV